MLGRRRTAILQPTSTQQWTVAISGDDRFGASSPSAMADRAERLRRHHIAENEKSAPRCGGEMKPGQALESTLVGEPDDIGGCVTVSPGGPGKLVPCMKCAECGWSVTVGQTKNEPPQTHQPRQARALARWGRRDESHDHPPHQRPRRPRRCGTARRRCHRLATPGCRLLLCPSGGARDAGEDRPGHHRVQRAAAHCYLRDAPCCRRAVRRRHARRKLPVGG